MKYGKSTTTNVAISPQFLTKMANDSDLEDEYIKEIGNMKKVKPADSLVTLSRMPVSNACPLPI